MPAELRGSAQWVRHDAHKRPLQASNGRNASSTAPGTWTSYEAAARSRHGVGLGYVLAGTGIVCVDLDHCLDGGKLAGWAQEVLDACPDTFVEISASGTGLHIWGHGTVPIGRRIRDRRNVEVYGDKRFIAMTGRRYGRAPRTLGDLGDLLATLRP